MSDVVNVRRVLGAGRLTARHSALFTTPRELRALETKTATAVVSADVRYSWTYIAQLGAEHMLIASVSHDASISASHVYTFTALLNDLYGAGFTLDYSRLGVAGLADAAGYEFALDQSPLATIPDALVDAAGYAYVLDVSQLE